MKIGRETLWRWFDTGWRNTIGLACRRPRETVILALSITLILAVA